MNSRGQEQPVLTNALSGASACDKVDWMRAIGHIITNELAYAGRRLYVSRLYSFYEAFLYLGHCLFDVHGFRHARTSFGKQWPIPWIEANGFQREMVPWFWDRKGDLCDLFCQRNWRCHLSVCDVWSQNWGSYLCWKRLPDGKQFCNEYCIPRMVLEIPIFFLRRYRTWLAKWEYCRTTNSSLWNMILFSVSFRNVMVESSTRNRDKIVSRVDSVSGVSDILLRPASISCEWLSPRISRESSATQRATRKSVSRLGFLNPIAILSTPQRQWHWSMIFLRGDLRKGTDQNIWSQLADIVRGITRRRARHILQPLVKARPEGRFHNIVQYHFGHRKSRSSRMCKREDHAPGRTHVSGGYSWSFPWSQRRRILWPLPKADVCSTHPASNRSSWLTKNPSHRKQEEIYFDTGQYPRNATQIPTRKVKYHSKGMVRWLIQPEMDVITDLVQTDSIKVVYFNHGLQTGKVVL